MTRIAKPSCALLRGEAIFERDHRRIGRRERCELARHFHSSARFLWKIPAASLTLADDIIFALGF
jgi:hypothetical protein